MLLLGLYSLIYLPIGFRSGFLRLEWQSDWLTCARVMAVIFVIPGLTEECTFRVALLPHPSEAAPPAVQWGWAVLSLAVFVVYHPLNFLVRHNTFRDPRFLVAAAILGGCCTLSYLQSGSLWTAVLIHWVIVVVWLLSLGGLAKLRPIPPE